LGRKDANKWRHVLATLAKTQIMPEAGRPLLKGENMGIERGERNRPERWLDVSGPIGPAKKEKE